MSIVFLYPPSPYLNHSMFKHYTYFAETIDVVSKRISDIHVMDCAVEMKSRDEIYSRFRTAEWLVVLVEPYNIITAVNLIKIAKDASPKVRTIVYGTAATLFSNYLTQYDEIDFVIGNGEFAEGIVDVIKGNDIKSRIVHPEVAMKEHKWGNSLNTEVPLNLYKYWGKKMFEFTVQIGCPYNCSFCSEKILFSDAENKIFEQRPVDECINILKRIKGNYDTVYFSATTFTYDKKWVNQLCDKMIENDCTIPWRTDTRVNCLDESLVRKMKAAGLKQLSLGVETLDDEILNSINKRQTSDDIINTILMCKKNGVDVKALLILGIPGQKAETVLHTQRTIEKLDIPYRWKEYSPIREIYQKDIKGEDISDDLSAFTRSEFCVNSIAGLSPEQYMKLLFPDGYIR